jgi:hypothetical protein
MGRSLFHDLVYCRGCAGSQIGMSAIPGADGVNGFGQRRGRQRGLSVSQGGGTQKTFASKEVHRAGGGGRRHWRDESDRLPDLRGVGEGMQRGRSGRGIGSNRQRLRQAPAEGGGAIDLRVHLGGAGCEGVLKKSVSSTFYPFLSSSYGLF